MQAEIWYFQINADAGQRVTSRILQVLGTQIVEPDEFSSRLTCGSLSVAFTLTTTEKGARRVGLLLRRLPSVHSAIWLLSPLETITPATGFAFSLLAAEGSEPDTNPDSSFWSEAPSVFFHAGNFGQAVTGLDTEIRARWTQHHFYFLFRCSYQDLCPLRTPAILESPTDELWCGDVAEIFLGEASDPFTRYGEFEVSPRSEWLDLLIEHQPGGKIHRAPLASRFGSAARIDADAKTWYAFFRIPCSAVCTAEARTGDRFRINFFRSQGDPAVDLCWRPTHQASFHVPSAFGTLVLVEA